MRPDLYLIGGGGHALVVARSARSAGLRALSVIDDDASCVACSRLGLMLAGTIAGLAGGSVRLDAPAILCVGTIATRRRLIDVIGASVAFATVADRSRQVDRVLALEGAQPDPGQPRIGAGTYLGVGAIVQPFARIGPHCIINTGAIVEHECELGENVHVAPGCVMGGNVRIGDDTLLGLGSRVLPGVRIGRGCTIGAGAVVTRDVADGRTLVGVPARARASG
jgi:sugar O-acyltransferase (sialic acid O-acetyltransferase NeuD family)